MEFLRNDDGYDIYSLGHDLSGLTPESLVIPGKFTVLLALWQADVMPRYRVTRSESMYITCANKQFIFDDIMSWWENEKHWERGVFLLISHYFASEEDFDTWERERLVIPFMRSQGAGWMMQLSE